MSTFTWVPDQGITKTSDPKVNATQFGDGYQQRSADTINNIKESWSLSFTLRTATEIGAIETFLEGLKGVTNFDWTTPAGQTKKYICKSWSSSYNHAGDSSLSASFERVYEQ